MKRINISLEDENSEFLQKYKVLNGLRNLEEAVNDIIKKTIGGKI